MVIYSFLLNFTISSISDGAHNMHIPLHNIIVGIMPWKKKKPYLEQQLFPLLFASQLFLSNWKKYSFFVCAEGPVIRERDVAGWCVPLRENPCCSTCAPCAQPLHISSLLFSRGKSSERHHFKAHTATYAFPCQQSLLTHWLIALEDLYSHRFLFPQLRPADLVILQPHCINVYPKLQ